MKNIQTRFDARIPRDQIGLFQKAAELGGFRSLTEFVIYSAGVQAEIIIRKHESMLASERDSVIFFNTIMNPPVPNDRLKKAFKEYTKSIE